MKSNQNDHRLTRAELAAKISFLVADLYHQIIDEQVKPAKIKGTPLDMGQYKNFFRSVRIPLKNRDMFSVADFDKHNNHVVILYKNNVYKVPVTDHEGDLYQSVDIAATIEEGILAETACGINVGALTTADRDMAAEIYGELNRSKVNAQTLQTIAEALVVISLDEASSGAEEALKHMMFHPANKYFDKTIQIIITKNGHLGFNIEHSSVDGTSVSAVISHISKGLMENVSHCQISSGKPSVQKMPWELTEAFVKRLTHLEEEHLQLKNDYSLLSKKFTDFGAEKIKGLRMSPDAFFHMALQLAQYRTYGQFKSVYEPVSIRYFNGGRTDCARATSMEKRRLVEAIESGTETNETLYSLMQTASDAHSARIRESQQGLGIERHLFGLEQMYHLFGAELGLKELPDIFQDEGYLMLQNDFISTSGMAYENAKYRMFAPIMREGHGLAYFLLENTMTLNLSSFIENEMKGKKLMNHMVEALNELRVIAESEVFAEDIS